MDYVNEIISKSKIIIQKIEDIEGNIEQLSCDLEKELHGQTGTASKNKLIDVKKSLSDSKCVLIEILESSTRFVEDIYSVEENARKMAEKFK